jgi:anaerobic selenocysteine-containing dehydrogenase
MFNFVRLSDGGEEPPPGELKSEVEVICSLAARVLPPGPFDFAAMRDHETVRKAIAAVVPGFEALRDIGSTKREFQITGRTFHQTVFATASKKAQARVPPLPPFRPGPGEFRLMTLRSEGQFNTVVYEEEDLYRGNTRRDVVMMAAEDVQQLEVQEGDVVDVVSETGRMRVVVALADLPPGNLAMYYPEANVLVPRKIDAASGTPAFKSVLCRIEVRPGTPPAARA